MGAITAELVDTGEKRDARGRRMTPAGRRAQLVHAYSSSGVSMAAFARREGIKYATFAHWVLKAQKRTMAKTPIKFAQVQMPNVPVEGGDLVEVRLPDGTILRGARVADIVTLVRALRS